MSKASPLSPDEINLKLAENDDIRPRVNHDRESLGPVPRYDGYLSSLSVGSNSIDIQTEILTEPKPSIVVTAYFFGRVLLSLEKSFRPGDRNARQLAVNYHRAMEKKIRTKLASHQVASARKKQSQPADQGANFEAELAILGLIEGIAGGCLVDVESGRMLWKCGDGPIGLDLFAAAGAEIIREKKKMIQALELSGGVEDILITFETQYHIIRPVTKKENLSLYVVLEREKTNLAMARHQLKVFEQKGLSVP